MILFVEKRKTAWWGVHGDPETGGSVVQGGDRVLVFFVYCLRVEMPFRCRWAFSGRRSVSLISCGLSFICLKSIPFLMEVTILPLF
jgi:hypothetical protein